MTRKVIVTIAGEDFEAEIESHSITQKGWETSVGIEMTFKPEDQRRLNVALANRKDDEGLTFRGLEEKR